ncbi:PQQ-binding-like beta-propeller repeat protein [Streptomyces sp. NPDC048172]|uniref:outer membrane protein assembly factor BamB family protein n=1 Tax=Streptomyces sp. NPDC048172 TaxID=3365505 RepID=UPI003720A436
MQQQTPFISRRRLLQTTGALGLAASASALSPTSTWAAPGRTRITDLGPGIVQFALMSGVLVGDTVCIGSRNLDPARLIGFHLPTRKVTSRTELASGHSVQALAADPGGRYVYAGVLSKSDGEPNLYRWDPRAPAKKAEALGRTGERDVRELTVAPDGTVFAVGGTPGKASQLWEYDPASGKVTGLGVPDPKATLARAVAATDTTVYFGAGSVLTGGGGAGKASLFAYDRRTREFGSVLPPELAKDPSLRELAVLDGKLVIGTSGSTGSAHLAVMDLTDPSSYTVVRTNGAMAKTLTSDDDAVYFTDDAGVSAFSKKDRTVSRVEFDGPELGEVWGLDHRDGKLVAVSAFGFVAEIDLSDRSCDITELGPAGAPEGPQSCMGIATDGRYAYVGGTGALARHDLRKDKGASGAVVNLRIPGEAKDAEIVDGVLHTGQYNSLGIWTYDPRDGRPPRQAAHFPHEQNRPLDVCFDPVNRLLLAGVQSDTEGGGSLWTYAPGTGKSRIRVNPVDEWQLVRAVATRRGTAYLGGDNPYTDGPRGTVVAYDPVAGEELWRKDLPFPTGVAALAVRGPHLYGLTRKGGFFVLDVRERGLVHTADLGELCPGFAAMTTARGVVHAVSDTTLFRFDPKTFAVRTVVPEINGRWYSGPHLAADPRGRIYTLRGDNLVRIDD